MSIAPRMLLYSRLTCSLRFLLVLEVGTTRARLDLGIFGGRLGGVRGVGGRGLVRLGDGGVSRREKDGC